MHLWCQNKVMLFTYVLVFDSCCQNFSGNHTEKKYQTSTADGARFMVFFSVFNRPEKLGHRRVVITKAIFKQDVMSIDQMTTALGDHDFFIEPVHLCQIVSFITNSSIQMTKRREIKRSFRLISPKHVYLKS